MASGAGHFCGRNVDFFFNNCFKQKKKGRQHKENTKQNIRRGYDSSHETATQGTWIGRDQGKQLKFRNTCGEEYGLGVRFCITMAMAMGEK